MLAPICPLPFPDFATWRAAGPNMDTLLWGLRERALRTHRLARWHHGRGKRCAARWCLREARADYAEAALRAAALGQPAPTPLWGSA